MKEMVLAFMGSIFPGILFNVAKKNLIWIGISGMLGWLTFSYISNITGKVVIPTLAGAIVVGLYSESMARLLKAPATVYSISGIFPLVPGIGAYNTVQYIVENRLGDAANKGIETIASAGAIAFGIMFITAVFRLPKKFKEIKENRRVL